MNLKGIITNTEFNDLVERIAKLIDKSLNTEVDDLSNITECIGKEIEEAYRSQQEENVEVNGGG